MTDYRVALAALTFAAIVTVGALWLILTALLLVTP